MCNDVQLSLEACFAGRCGTRNVKSAIDSDILYGKARNSDASTIVPMEGAACGSDKFYGSRWL